MAVVITKSAIGHTSGNATSLTYSHVSDGNPLYVLVAYNSSTNFSTGVTFNGTALSKRIGKVQGSFTFELWGLNAPATATANIVISANASGLILGTSDNATGAELPSVITPDQLYTANGSSTAPTVAVTSRTLDLILGLCVNATTSQTFTDAVGQTRLVTDTGATTNLHGASSTAAGAASLNFAYTLGTTGTWAICALNLANSLTASASRVSQLAGEIVGSGTQGLRVSQLALELVDGGSNELRTSQYALEVLTPNSISPQRVSQFVGEIIGSGTQGIRVSQLAIEIISKNQAIVAVAFPPHMLMY